MNWLLLGAGWILFSFVVGVVIGRSIRHADESDGGSAAADRTGEAPAAASPAPVIPLPKSRPRRRSLTSVRACLPDRQRERLAHRSAPGG
jgi:hypothetical protein